MLLYVFIDVGIVEVSRDKEGSWVIKAERENWEFLKALCASVLSVMRLDTGKPTMSMWFGKIWPW